MARIDFVQAPAMGAIGRPGRHRDLAGRLRAKALVLAVQAEMSASQTADALLVMAGVTTAGPIAVRRALASLQTANARRPSLLTAAAVEALLLARTRLPARRSEPSE